MESISRNANLWLNSRKLEVSGWSSTSIYQKALEESFLGKAARKEANKRLQQVRQTYPMYTSLQLVDPKGNVVASSAESGEQAAQSLSENEGLNAALQGELQADHGVWSTQATTPVSSFYAPIKKNSATVGVLVADVDLTFFSADFVKPLQPGETGEVEVFDSNGAVFLSSNNAQDFSRNLSSIGVLERVTNDKGAITFIEDGHEHIASYFAIEGLPWTALISAHEDEVMAEVRDARLLSTLTSIVVALFVGGGVFLSVRKILRPVTEAVDSLKDLSQGNGDLTQRLRINSNDEIGELGNYFNQFVEKLHQIIGRVKNNTESVAASSDALAGITELSNTNLNRQRSEIEMIAGAVTEMSSAAQIVAKNAAEAAGFAEKVDHEAATGKNVVGRTIDSIDGLANEVENSAQVIAALRAESQNIGTVLDVIKGIAEQTNLLALNAAIEAARAGEMGRGFAVVADEVRTLAQRTQESTQEIEQIIDSLQSKASQASERIEDSQARAKTTVQHAKEAGEALQSITTAVEHITDMNHQIATAAEEQSSVTEEITTNVANIQDVTDEVSDTAQRTSQSSQELNQSSTDLKQIVSMFRV